MSRTPSSAQSPQGVEAVLVWLCTGWGRKGHGGGILGDMEVNLLKHY